MALDGVGDSERALVGAIRSLGGSATNDALMLETGLQYRTLRKAAKRLEERGRLRREQVEGWQAETGGTGVAMLSLAAAQMALEGWMQLALPSLDVYLEPAFVDEERAGSRRRLDKQRRAPVQQLELAFRKSRRAARHA
jgi:hypothetical protein